MAQDFLPTSDTQTFLALQSAARALNCTLTTNGYGTYKLDHTSNLLLTFVVYDFLSGIVTALERVVELALPERVPADQIERSLLELAATIKLVVHKTTGGAYNVSAPRTATGHCVRTLSDLADYFVAHECAVDETERTGVPNAVVFEHRFGWTFSDYF